jgi:hypothetical protein
MVNANSRTIALAIAVLATSAASAQEDVILFGDIVVPAPILLEDFNVTFQYNTLTNTASGVFTTDPYIGSMPIAGGGLQLTDPLCPTGAAESVAMTLTPNGGNLNVSGTASWAGCNNEVAFNGGVAIIPGAQVFGYANAGYFASPASVPEPGTGALLVLGLLSIAAFRALPAKGQRTRMENRSARGAVCSPWASSLKLAG